MQSGISDYYRVVVVVPDTVINTTSSLLELPGVMTVNESRNSVHDYDVMVSTPSVRHSSA
jgi:hypothetical protein